MKDTSIEWCDHTFNPWEGCTKVSDGCKNCYAEGLNNRFRAGENWGKGAPRRRTSEANWKLPLRWSKYLVCSHCNEAVMRSGIVGSGNAGNREGGVCPVCYDADSALRRPRVFCASMADWLDDEVPIEWLAELLDLIRLTPSLDWLLLTKRPEDWRGRIMDVQASLSADRQELCDWLGDWRLSCEPDWSRPPANIWIGVSVENQEQANKRIPKLLEIPAKVRFLSCEPLLGPVNLRAIEDGDGNSLDALTGDWGIEGRGHTGPRDERIHWVICGGESGPKARPMHPDWARRLRGQCGAAGVPFFFKQWGEWGPRSHHPEITYSMIQRKSFRDRHRVVWNSTGQDTATGYDVLRVGKKRAGRLLDGVEHSEFPKGGAA